MTSPNPNLPGLRIMIAFNAGPGSNVTPVWNDITSRVQQFATTRGRQYELDQVQAGTMTATVLDPDEQFNPANPSSPYAGNLLPYRQIFVQALWPPTAALAGGPNLLTLQDPGFEITSVGGPPPGDYNWSLVGGTATVSAAQAWQGVHSLTFPVVGGVMQGVRWKLACTPGTQYTFSCYVYQTAGNSMQVGLANGLSDTNVTFAATGTATTAVNAWTRISLTFTATQPKHNLWIMSQSPLNSATVYVDGLQLEQAAAPTTWSTVGPALYFLFGGYVERWPAAWEQEGNTGIAAITCVDALAILALQAVHGEVANQILADQPVLYWPLWEETGASSFAEVSGTNGPILRPVVSKYGSGDGIAAGTSSVIVGDPNGVSVEFTNDATGSRAQAGTTIGAGTNCNGTTGIPATPPNPAATWSVSACAWVKGNVSSSLSNGTILTLYQFAAAGSSTSFSHITPLVLFVTGSGGLPYLDYQSVATQTGYNYEVNGPNTVLDGAWHLIVGVVTQTSSTTTLTLYVDGQQVASGSQSTSSLGGMLSVPATNVQIGGELYPGSQTNVWFGDIAHVAVWNSALSAAQISTLWSAGLGWAGEYSGSRITRLATLAYPLPILTDTGASAMSASHSANGSFCLDVLNDIAISEVGTLFVDASGTIRFKSRTSRFLQTTGVWSFGEAEVPYLDGVSYDYDPTHVYNDLEITRNGGIVVHAVDTASQQSYFDRQLTQTIYVASDQETIDHTGYLLNKYKQPVVRLNGLTIDPASNKAAWPTALGVELNQRVTVKRRARPFTLSNDYFIERVDHAYGADGPVWTTAIQASPVDRQQVWVIGDAVYGVLDTTTVLAF